MRSCVFGCVSSGGEARGANGHGSASTPHSGPSYLQSKSCNLTQGCVSTPKSEVGTVCVSSASTGLCGGCQVTGIPTVTRVRTLANARLTLTYSSRSHDCERGTHECVR